MVYLQTIVKLAGFDKDVQLLKTFYHSHVKTLQLYLIQRDVLAHPDGVLLDWGHLLEGKCEYMLVHNHNPSESITGTLVPFYFGAEPCTITIPANGWMKLNYIAMDQPCIFTGTAGHPITVIYTASTLSEPE